MFGMDDTKIQGDEAPQPAGQPNDVIISPDTRRDKRIPPGSRERRNGPFSMRMVLLTSISPNGGCACGVW